MEERDRTEKRKEWREKDMRVEEGRREEKRKEEEEEKSGGNERRDTERGEGQ